MFISDAVSTVSTNWLQCLKLSLSYMFGFAVISVQKAVIHQAAAAAAHQSIISSVPLSVFQYKGLVSFPHQNETECGP